MPGGRVLLTSWQPVDPGDQRLPERIRRVDLDAGLHGAGFIDVEVGDRPQWLAYEAAVWREAVALDPGDDPALLSFHAEAVRTLGYVDGLRRVMAAATAP